MDYILYNDIEEYGQRAGMLVQEFEVKFFQKSDGSEPAKDFIDGLDAKMFAKIIRATNILKAGGIAVREPYSKHLDDGIFEVRAKVGTDISRVLYFFFTGRRIILTHGLIKKTQKAPTSEIEQAKKYRAQYLSREENRQ